MAASSVVLASFVIFFTEGFLFFIFPAGMLITLSDKITSFSSSSTIFPSLNPVCDATVTSGLSQAGRVFLSTNVSSGETLLSLSRSDMPFRTALTGFSVLTLKYPFKSSFHNSDDHIEGASTSISVCGMPEGKETNLNLKEVPYGIVHRFWSSFKQHVCRGHRWRWQKAMEEETSERSKFDFIDTQTIQRGY